MMFKQFSTMMVVAALLVLATSAFAGGSAHKGSVTFGDSVQINGKQVPAGDYTVIWDGDGPNVNLRILRGRQEMAAAPATVKNLESKSTQTAAETRKNESGSSELTAIRFSGQNVELQLNSTGAQSEAKNGDSVK